MAAWPTRLRSPAARLRGSAISIFAGQPSPRRSIGSSQPARLTWSPEGKAIIVASARRGVAIGGPRGGESAWIYDVSAVALPLEEDLTKLNDHNKAVAESQKAADEFLAAVRTALKVEDES